MNTSMPPPLLHRINSTLRIINNTIVTHYTYHQ
ncbi:Protein of unknown function [Pyronema omphalodes CBS 100304]|uniref:Uncharacterized protein n=1 Tax=Pyronema omphalodes (strain CBS 100304) TaxID=1076935 RepID=U4L6L3_PYROM|nr:Protein of unknown function [Pyronema omphalodes CBS 100304]